MTSLWSGDFSSALKIIANQPETITKIKEQFEYLLEKLKNTATTRLSNPEAAKVNIEPLFIKISTHNAEMGNWILNKLLQKFLVKDGDAEKFSTDFA